jgi:hypothetical protein
LTHLKVFQHVGRLLAVMCRVAGKPTRENLKWLIAHYQWLETLVEIRRRFSRRYQQPKWHRA